MKKVFLTLTCSFVFSSIQPGSVDLNTNPIPAERRKIKESYYKVIRDAIVQIESGGNNLAVGKDNDLGLFQITPIRVQDYNQKTGKNYQHSQMTDSVIAEEIFRYYAESIGIHPVAFERIAREWNGGYTGMKKNSTLAYWDKIKNVIK